MNRLDSLPHRLTTAVILTLALLLPGRVAAQELLADEQNTMNIANTAGPSVVAVRIAGLEGMPSRGSERGLTGGSGFVVDADGLIITNFHVVAGALAKTDDDNLALVDGASISVSYAGNPQQDYPVTLKGANPDIDMALLELKQPDQAPRRDPIPLGDSDQVKVGQKVVVIGNPFGLHSSVTAGIVSGVERERPGLVGIKIPYIQTDAAINPGNSGGPMLNSAGEVIGISNVVLSPAGTFAGISLAVPVNLLHESMSDLKAGGLSGLAAAAAELPEKPRLGLQVEVTMDYYPPNLRKELGLPAKGAAVTSVAKGGPADRAGIRGPQRAITIGPRAFPVGMDVILAIDGKEVASAIDVQRQILKHGKGDSITLKLWREGSEREVKVPLEVVEASN